MLLTITASLLIGATAGLLFNIRMVLHLTILAAIACGLAALAGLATPAGAALHAVAALIALQCGYFVSLIIAALGLAQEPAAVDHEHAEDRSAVPPRAWKRPRV